MKWIVKIGLTVAFGLYLFILTKFILFKHLAISDIMDRFAFRYGGPYWNSHNFVPFKTIANYLFLANDINFNIRVQNLMGNIIGFIPFGFMVSLWSGKFQSMKKIGIATFGLSLTYELLQLVFRFGSFDVDDLILNTIGGMIGYIPVKLASVYMNRSQKPLGR